MRNRLLFLLSGLLIGGPLSAQVATKVRYGVTRTTDSLNETRAGYALIPAAGKALRTLIDANTLSLSGVSRLTGYTDPVPDTETYTLYISRTGNDANAGTSPAAPVQTIRRLQALALAAGNGVKIKFMEAARYREQLDLSSLSNVTVNANFSTLDAADLVPKYAQLWTQENASTQPNVWKITWNTAAVNESFPIVIDGKMPLNVASTALVDATPGSYYIAASDLADGSPLTIYVNSGTDPNVNAVRYEFPRRFNSLYGGAGFTVRNLIGQTNADNNGSLDITLNAAISNSLFAYGHKHNLFWGSGSLSDVIAWDATGHPQALNPFILYRQNPAGLNATLTRAFALAPGVKMLSAGFDAHGDPNLRYGTITVNQGFVVNFTAFGTPYCQTYSVLNSYGYVQSAVGSSNHQTLSVERTQFRTTPATDGPIYTLTGNTTLRNVATYITSPGNRGVIEVYSGLSSLTLDRVTFAGARKEGWVRQSPSGNSAISVNRVVFGYDGGAHMQLEASDTYTGNYNVFFQNQYGQVQNFKGGTAYRTLTDWQTATGQDAQSVYVTQEQKSRFWLGDPAAGDFRISPNAQVTGADGTVYTGTFPDGTALTSSGAQEHYSHTDRVVVGTAPIAWPVLPASYEQAVQYIRNPAGWRFHGTAGVEQGGSQTVLQLADVSALAQAAQLAAAAAQTTANAAQAGLANYAPKLGVSNDFTVDGTLRVPTVNGRWMGFYGLSAGQTVRLQMGDPTGGLDVTSGAGMTAKAYHGVIVQNQDGGIGPGLRVNGLAGNRNISEYYDASGTLRAAMSQAGQLTANGGIKFGDGTTMTTVPTGGGSSVTTFANTLSELAAATTRLVVYDGSTWVRVAGNVESNVGSNTIYTATQYNSGSDHYERQFPGRAKFEWWRNSASNTWEQLKYAANSQLDVQVANGDYSFNERVYISPGTHIFGNETSPDSVRFHINGPNPYLFMNWPWMDGTNGMQGSYRKKAENIVLAGFTLYNESSYVAKKDTNDFYGPISIDGGGSFNNVIRNVKYKQVSSTAIVNVVLVKMGTQKVCESLLIDNVQSLTSTVKGRMLVEVLNQGEGSSSPERVQVPARGVEVRNCIADGFRFGISVAGNFLKPYVHHNIVRNCTDYGIEFAGPLVDGRCEYNGFGGTQNVLIAANYVAGTAADWVFPTGSGQRYVGNYTEGKVTGGYVEIRSGGVIDFSDNNFQIDGGIYLQQTTVAGVRGGQFTRNRIVSTMTNGNWKAVTTNLIYFNGASGVHFSNNYLERGGTDASAIVQSNDNGVSSVVNYYYNNALKTGTNGTYWGNANTTGVRWNNFDITGTARN